MDTLSQDIRYAVRTLSRSRGFAVIAVLSLALGIAACTTIFSAMDTLILRALPFPGIERLVAMTEFGNGCTGCSTSVGDYAAVRRADAIGVFIPMLLVIFLPPTLLLLAGLALSWIGKGFRPNS